MVVKGVEIEVMRHDHSLSSPASPGSAIDEN